MKNTLLIYVVVLGLLSCSKSEERGDEILSDTVWSQSYTEPGHNIAEDHYDEIVRPIMKQLLSRLESYGLPTEYEPDTVWNIREAGEYFLIFGGEACVLKSTHYRKGDYYVNTYERLVTFYPDQTYTENAKDIVDGTEYINEIILKGDSVVLTGIYPDGREKVFYRLALDGKNRIYERGGLVSTSDPIPYEKEFSETYHMSFTRNGRDVELTGDKHLTGVINADYDEMELSEIGTLYRE